MHWARLVFFCLNFKYFELYTPRIPSRTSHPPWLSSQKKKTKFHRLEHKYASRERQEHVQDAEEVLPREHVRQKVLEKRRMKKPCIIAKSIRPAMLNPMPCTAKAMRSQLQAITAYFIRFTASQSGKDMQRRCKGIPRSK